MTRNKCICIIQKHKETQKYLLQQKKGVHRMKNTNQMYLSAQEVANILGMSESYAYTVIRKMNDELKARGCITIAGKIPTKYFEEKFFGVQVIQ